MAWEGPQIKIPGLVAGASLATAQYKFVKLSADKTVVVCSGVTDVPIGVLQNNPASGEAAEVCAVGVTKIQGDGDLTAGDAIGTSGDGQAQTVTVGSETTVYIAGRVLEGNGAAGGLATAIVSCAAAARAA